MIDRIHKTLCLALWFCSFIPLNSLAQDLYLRNNDIAKQAVEEYAKKYGKDSLQEQARYSEVMEKAFKKYWESDKVIVTVIPDTLSKLDSEIKRLKREQQDREKSLRDSINTLNAQRKALAEVKSQLEARQKENADKEKEDKERQDEEKESLRNRQKVLRDSIQTLTQKKEEINGQIQCLKDSIPRLNELHTQLEEQNKNLVREIETAQKTGQLLSDKQVQLQQTKISVDNVWIAATTQSLLELDADVVKKAIDDYNGYRSLMVTLSPSVVPELDSKVGALPSYLKLSDLNKQSVEQMKGIFSEGKNKKLHEELSEALTHCSALSGQVSQEVNEILLALSQQKLFREKFSEFLSKIPEEIVCLGTESLRTELMNSPLFKTEYRYFVQGGQYFNQYYEAINAAVEKVYNDLKENGDEKNDNLKTEDLFKAYFNKLKKQF